MVARELVEKKLQNSCELIPFEEADDLEQKQKLAEADADDLEQKQELTGADADVDGALEDSRTPN